VDVRVLRAARLMAHQSALRGEKQGLIPALCVAAVPLLTSMAYLGYRWGASLPSSDPKEASMTLPALLGGGALLSGIWDGTCALRFTAFRPFLVTPGALFQAELLVGLWTPVKRLLWAAGFTFCLGAAWTCPRVMPWTFLALPALILALFALERLVGVGARRFGRSLKTMVLFGGLFLGMRWLIAYLMAGGNLRRMPTGQHLPTLPGVSVDLFRLMPSTWLAHSLQAAAQRGRPSWGFFLFLVCVAGLLFIAYRALLPDLAGSPPVENRGATKAPVFKRPWVGVAGLHLSQILGSKVGRFSLFLPVFALASLIDPILFGFRPGSTWILAWSGLVFLSVGRKLACNLFGMDRGGVRSFWVLPLDDRDLLKGKLLGTAFFQGLILALMLGCLALGAPLSPLELVGGGLFLASLCTWHLRIGLVRSLECPFPLDAEGLHMVELDDPTLVTLGRLLLPWLVLVLVWAIAIRLGPLSAIWAMLVATMAAGLALLRRLPMATRMLGEDRERFTMRLEGGASEKAEGPLRGLPQE